MRLPSADAALIAKHFPELDGAALIRELHTYGKLVSIGERIDDASQHTGLGRRMLERAETIAADNGYKKSQSSRVLAYASITAAAAIHSRERTW